jgi:hypothetical protein
MNSIQKLLAGIFCGLVFITYSCNKNNDDPVGCNWAVEVQGEIQAFSDAATAYAMNPTTANCNAYINAYQNYLNALEDHIDCATIFGNQAELQAAINEAQAELNNTPPC